MTTADSILLPCCWFRATFRLQMRNGNWANWTTFHRRFASCLQKNLAILVLVEKEDLLKVFTLSSHKEVTRWTTVSPTQTD